MAIGENLTRIRTARGLTQDALAHESGVSVDTISRLERGTHHTARRSTLAALARTLGVDPARLLGGRAEEQDTVGAEQLRRAVHALDLPDFAEPLDLLPLADLHDAAGLAWTDYLGGRRTELLAGLPALMTDTRRAVGAMHDDHRADAAGLLATAYRLVAGLAGRIGLVDLAAHAAHRAYETARHTARPELDEAAALRYLAWVLVRQGDLAGAEQLAVRAAERLDGGLRAAPDPDRVGVFGPRVAAMQGVDQAARLGEPDRALRLAAQLPDARGAVPGFWESGHRLHLAAACADLGRWNDVLDHLHAAAALAPQWSRVQPLGRTVAAQLVEHRGRRTDRLSAVARHYDSHAGE